MALREVRSHLSGLARSPYEHTVENTLGAKKMSPVPILAKF